MNEARQVGALEALSNLTDAVHNFFAKYYPNGEYPSSASVPEGNTKGTVAAIEVAQQNERLPTGKTILPLTPTLDAIYDTVEKFKRLALSEKKPERRILGLVPRKKKTEREMLIRIAFQLDILVNNLRAIVSQKEQQ